MELACWQCLSNQSELTHKLGFAVAVNCMLVLDERWGDTSLLSHAGKRRVEGKKGLMAKPIGSKKKTTHLLESKICSEI